MPLCRTRCRRVLATIPMNETKTIGSMTERQRHALATVLTAESGGTQPLAAHVLDWPA